MMGISFCVIGRKLEPLDRTNIGLQNFRCYLRVISLSLTPIICHVLVYCFGSFLFQGLFLCLQVFAFKGQNMH